MYLSSFPPDGASKPRSVGSRSANKLRDAFLTQRREGGAEDAEEGMSFQTKSGCGGKTQPQHRLMRRWTVACLEMLRLVLRTQPCSGRYPFGWLPTVWAGAKRPGRSGR